MKLRTRPFLFRLSPGLKDRAGNESEEAYTFRVKAAGPLSKPPSLVGLRLPKYPVSENSEGLCFSPADIFADLPITSGEQFPFGEEIDYWIELYFETAPYTEIDPFSVMDLFRVEATNQALSFSAKSIRTENFTWTDPNENWESFQRLEIRGKLKLSVYSGIVSFRIPPGLRDKRGNSSAVDFRVSLLK